MVTARETWNCSRYKGIIKWFPALNWYSKKTPKLSSYNSVQPMLMKRLRVKAFVHILEYEINPYISKHSSGAVAPEVVCPEPQQASISSCSANCVC